MRIAFYGNFGAGNLGNEVTLQTALEHARERWPDAELLCFCTEPQDVQRRHGIDALRAGERAPQWSWKLLTEQPAARAGDRPQLPPGPSGAARRLTRVARRLLYGAFVRIPREIVHWARMLVAVGRCDMLIVPGTGIVTDSSGSLCWPYDMFRLSILAALWRVKILYLSVGVGPIRSPAGRWLLKRALGLAWYRSFRDQDSKQYMQRVGLDTAADPVHPDLVFGLAPAQLALQGVRPQRMPVVGLGLKDYSPERTGTNSYRDYIDTMARFSTWLQAQGYAVRLLIGDAQYDSQVRSDLLEELRIRNSADHVLVDPVPTVAELLRQLSETDVVISPRFHNLILALLLHKPVIALSDLRKVEVLLKDLGLSRYCLAIGKMECDTLILRFTELQKDHGRLKSYIAEKVGRLREGVERQYASVFAGASARIIPSR